MRVKAIALLSGGLDSILAIRLLQEQSIEIIALNFSSPFFSKKNAIESAKQLKVKVIHVDLGKGKDFQEYLTILKKPKHGYGSAMNPCIDCKVFMLRKAKQLMEKEKASFIITGEVLNERPMSQTKHTLMLIEKESGLEGKILRPLSAKLLPETIAEKKGLVDRNKLLEIQGRQRKEQIKLAEKWNLSYPTPAGGCLLCEKDFGSKLKELFEHKKKIQNRDIELLKIGRHFRYKKNKIIVGRNEQENKKLMRLAKGLIFEVKDWPSPITVLEGKAYKKNIEIAAALTLSHSDAKKQKEAVVKYGKRKLNKSIKISSINRENIEKLRV